jgi:hypothetical protein
MILRPPLLAFALLALLGACAGERDRHADAAKARLIFSPNGEPLNGGSLGTRDCAEAMSTWFDRIDTDHDGRIERGEFLDDARRQFAAMDLNKDGTITPAELEAYREPYRLHKAVRKELADLQERGPEPDQSESGRRSGRHRGIPAETRPRESRDTSADIPDPVMIADVNLDNKVTMAEFLAYAEGNFADMNRAHDGHLTRAELLQTCGGN